jgi:hypothetical protein
MAYLHRVRHSFRLHAKDYCIICVSIRPVCRKLLYLNNKELLFLSALLKMSPSGVNWLCLIINIILIFSSNHCLQQHVVYLLCKQCGTCTSNKLTHSLFSSLLWLWLLMQGKLNDVYFLYVLNTSRFT